MKKIAFDNELYTKIQSEHILERAAQFEGKLYLEFGGKLFDDEHASRVLPGFLPDSKLQMLLKMKNNVEIVIAISASDIENNKQRNDFGIGYDQEVLRLIDSFRNVGLLVENVVITQFKESISVRTYKETLEKLGVKVYLHYTIPGYPHQIDKVVSEDGFGKNEYVKTTRPIVVVTAPGPGSGKLATCLSQMYQDNQRGIKAGYAKFETFPIWNIPLRHPVNLAYEAATLDLNDVNMIDPFHLEKYSEVAINYNRDVEAFPLLSSIFHKISGSSPYYSPTDMGVNMAGYCIKDDEAARYASQQEIIRRYFQVLCDETIAKATEEMIDRAETILTIANTSIEQRRVVKIASEKQQECGVATFAIELSETLIVVGKKSDLLSAPAAALLNALKSLANIADTIPLIPEAIIKQISNLKLNHLGHTSPDLTLEEVLIAVSISALTNPLAEVAMQQLPKLINCECHSSVILDQPTKTTIRRLKMNTTCSPQFPSSDLYQPK